MPYKDIEKHRRVSRCLKRTARHGNWRLAVDKYAGMCAVCGETIPNCFHEPFGEDNRGRGVFQTRRRECNECHSKEDPGVVVLGSHYPSKIIEDIGIEVEECGSYKAWCHKYDVPYEGEQLCLLLTT